MTTSLNSQWDATRAAVSQLTVLETVGSTNDWARTHSLKPNAAVMSLNQTAGRGRWNRSWVARPGEALALTVGIPTTLSIPAGSIPPQWAPLMAGAVLAHALQEEGFHEVGVKWPNDVLVSGLKIAGILVELDPRNIALVGIGVNLFFDDEDPAPRSTSWKLHEEFSAERLDEFLKKFLQHLFYTASLGPELIHEFVRSLTTTIGREVRVETIDGKVWRGRAVDLDSDGALIVENARGERFPQRVSEIHHLNH